jgi:hypothetical protein
VFVTNHVLAGATIGALLGRHPATAFVAGFASHLAMDACPHWGVGDGPGSQERFLHIARCDGCAGLAAMGAGAALAGRGHRVAAVAAMAGAAAPDLDKPCLHFFGFNPFPDWFQAFHVAIQTESPERFRQEVGLGLALACLGVVALRVAGRAS